MNILMVHPHDIYSSIFSGVTPAQASSSISLKGPLISLKYSGPKHFAGKTFTMVAPAVQALYISEGESAPGDRKSVV